MVTTTLLISTYNWKEALDLSIRSAFLQTVLPSEIIIADDGSTPDTAEVIEKLRKLSPVPIIHVWHEDKGFRKTHILNEAVAQATGDYMIEIDGDIVLERHFIQDHLSLMQKGYYVCGSRTKIPRKLTEEMTSKGELNFSWWQVKVSHIMNRFRSRIVRNMLACRYKQAPVAMRACNMAFWKEDFIRVNGYNEDITGWGYEDIDLAVRFSFAGVKKKFLKMGGVCYHLWHPQSSKSRTEHNKEIFNRMMTNKEVRCAHGIADHFPHKNVE